MNNYVITMNIMWCVLPRGTHVTLTLYKCDILKCSREHLTLHGKNLSLENTFGSHLHVK